jgi:hypothetical protein
MFEDLWESSCIDLCFLESGSGQFYTPATLPLRKQRLVPTGEEAVWASELVWKVVEPAASCYTDCAIPAPISIYVVRNTSPASRISFYPSIL